MSRPSTLRYWKTRKVYYCQIDGERHYLGSDKKKAQAAFHRLMSGTPATISIPVAGGDVLIVELIEKFLTYVENNLAPDTYEWYRSRLQCWSEAHPDMTLLTLKKHHVRTWIDGIEGKPGTKRNYARSIQRCLSWCEEEDVIERSPIGKFKKPAGGKRERIISLKEYGQILSLAGCDEFRDLMTASWESGCRPQESLIVEARHVDLVHSRWFIPKDEGKKGLDHDRSVYLNDKALEITERLMSVYPEGPLFRNSEGKAWTTDSVNCAFIRIQTRLGLAKMKVEKLKKSKHLKGPERDAHHATVLARRKERNTLARSKGEKFCLYNFRHSWMNRMLTSGVDSLIVAVLAGHIDPTTLATTYQHLSQNSAFLLSQAKRAG